MVILHRGRLVFEHYPAGGSVQRAHELASGTKSFCGVMVAAAVADGFLSLDELAANALPEWRDDPLKKRITVRQILSLTSGLHTRRARGDLLTYEEAVQVPVAAEPGTVFAYGGDPFQLFGAILMRKLRDREDPDAYLKRRVLEPAGIVADSWRRGSDGLPHLGSGARLTARNWAQFGELVRNGGKVAGQALVDTTALAACFVGTRANPAYGLSWWLNRSMPADQRASIPQLRFGNDISPDARSVPLDLVFAAGAGKQRLYISRAQELVVVRQAEGIREALGRREVDGFSDAEFWRLLREGTGA